MSDVSYPPVRHQEYRWPVCQSFIRRFPLATVITCLDNQVLVSHLPTAYQEDGGFYGQIISHIDALNPQAAQLVEGAWAELIYHGPDTYISPAVYSTKQLPTYNYLKVHVRGRIKPMTSSDQTRDSLIQLAEYLEGDTPRFVLSPDHPSMNALLGYIKGFSLQIESFEGKFKVSQDKRSKDRHRAMAELLKHTADEDHAFIRSLLKDHIKEPTH